MRSDYKTTLEVLICTCNDSIANLLEGFPEPQANVSYLISHQCFGYQSTPVDHLVNERLGRREDVRIVRVRSRGLSNNRNNALAHARGDILLIADDDVSYEPDFAQKIFTAFLHSSDADVITFQIRTPQGTPFKTYYPDGMQHTRISLFRVASIEIACLSDSLRRAMVEFDTRFGLNAEFPSCEETVFLADLLKKKCKLIASDNVIAVHPADSSGSNYATDSSCIVRGATLRRVFGISGLPLICAYAIKHHNEYKSSVSFLRFVKLAFKGFVNIGH